MELPSKLAPGSVASEVRNWSPWAAGRDAGRIPPVSLGSAPLQSNQCSDNSLAKFCAKLPVPVRSQDSGPVSAEL